MIGIFPGSVSYSIYNIIDDLLLHDTSSLRRVDTLSIFPGVVHGRAWLYPQHSPCQKKSVAVRLFRTNTSIGAFCGRLLEQLASDCVSQRCWACLLLSAMNVGRLGNPTSGPSTLFGAHRK